MTTNATESIFQMIRIGDLLEFESVDDWEDKTKDVGEILTRKQDHYYSIGPIFYGLAKYGLWKTGIIHVRNPKYLSPSGLNNFKTPMRHGDGHHRLAVLYMILGEDGWIPYRFSETGYLNESHTYDPHPSSETLEHPWSIEELIQFKEEMLDKTECLV